MPAPVLFMLENRMSTESVNSIGTRANFEFLLVRQTSYDGFNEVASDTQATRIARTQYKGQMADLARQIEFILRNNVESIQASGFRWSVSPVESVTTNNLTGVLVRGSFIILDAVCPTDIDPVNPRVSEVEFSVDGAVYAGFVQVDLSTETDLAAIYYTTNGTLPTSQNGTLFVEGTPILITATTQIRARGFREGYLPSNGTAQTYIIIPLAVTANRQGGTYLIGELETIVLEANSIAALIYYTTDGSEPTESSTQFTAPIPGFLVNTNLRFRAFDSPAAPSAIGSVQYNIKLLPPIVTPSTGTFITDSLVAFTAPELNHNVFASFNAAAFVDVTDSSELFEITTNYIAECRNVNNVTSDQVIGTISIQVATPVISPNGGTFEDSQIVTVTNATPDAVIRFTTNGTDPTSSSTIYNPASKPVLTDTANFRARGFKTGCIDSAIANVQFTRIEIVYLAANTLRAYRSTNRGTAWAEIQPYGNVNKTYRLAKAASGGLPLVFGSSVDAIRVTTDGVNYFTPTLPTTNVIANQSRQTFAFDGSGGVLITDHTNTGENNVFISSDNLATFQNLIVNGNTTGGAFTGIAKRGNTVLVTSAEVNSAAGFLSTDGGSTWTLINPGSRVRGTSPYISKNGQGILFFMRNASDSAAVVYVSTDGGATNSLKNTGLIALYAACSDNLQYIILSDGGITARRSTNSGDSVTIVNFPAAITNISCDESGQYWMVLTAQRAYLSTDFGANFTETQPAGNFNRDWRTAFIQPDTL
jgi:hypothetical protein